MHDNELWYSYKDGDVKALEGLYEQYYSPLTNYGFKFTSDNACIEESMQDLFLKLWQNRERIARPAVVKQYLYLSFRRILLRKLEYNPSRHEEELSGEHIPFRFDLIGEHPVVKKERMAELIIKANTLHGALTNRQREAVFLKYYEELSYEEIAEIMHMNTGVANILIYRAHERLREQFRDFTLLQLLYLLKRS